MSGEEVGTVGLSLLMFRSIPSRSPRFSSLMVGSVSFRSFVTHVTLHLPFPTRSEPCGASGEEGNGRERVIGG